MPIRTRMRQMVPGHPVCALLAALVLLGICGATVLVVYGSPYDLSAAGLLATLTALPGARLLDILRRRDGSPDRLVGR